MENLFKNFDAGYNFLTDEEKRMTGKKQPRTNRRVIINKLRLKRQGKTRTVLFPASFHFRVCVKPLSSLNRTTVRDLQVNVPSEGNYIILRSLDFPVKSREIPTYGSNILLPVEDHLGEATMCCLYGYVYNNIQKTMEEILPQSTVFALKEPCLKYCSNGNFAVVVGSPSDFILIDLSHALAKDLESFGWREKIPGEFDFQPSSERALEWKGKGNYYYTIGKHYQAIEAYRVALGLANDSETKLVLHLNLAASYLTLGFFELTVKHANNVLKEKPFNEKAMYRAGRAHYELRQYEVAKRHFQNVLLRYPSNNKAAVELARCEDRLEEGKGNVDVYKLYCLNRDNSSSPIDCGKYVGPISLPSGPRKSRGIFAIEDIKPGCLILVETSTVVTFSSSSCLHLGMEKLIWNAIDAVMKNPETFGREMYSLSTGKPEIDGNQNIFCDEQNGLEPIVDVYRIHKILFNNVLNTDLIMDKFYPSIWQLFTTACGFDHSCMANSNFLVYNDVILVRTCRPIKKGEEVTMSHISTTMTYTTRKALKQFYGFQCKCLLCETDLTETEEIHNRRDALRDDKNALINGSPVVCLGDLFNVVKKVEDTYNNRATLRVHLFRMYLLIAHSVMIGAIENWEAVFVDLIEKGLQGVGLSLQLLLWIAENEDAHFPRNALIWDDLFEYAALMVEKEYACGRVPHLIRWVKVLQYLELIFRGGNTQMLQERFESNRNVYYILAAFKSVDVSKYFHVTQQALARLLS